MLRGALLQDFAVYKDVRLGANTKCFPHVMICNKDSDALFTQLFDDPLDVTDG